MKGKIIAENSLNVFDFLISIIIKLLTKRKKMANWVIIIIIKLIINNFIIIIYLLIFLIFIYLLHYTIIKWKNIFVLTVFWYVKIIYFTHVYLFLGMLIHLYLRQHSWLVECFLVLNSLFVHFRFSNFTVNK